LSFLVLFTHSLLGFDCDTLCIYEKFEPFSDATFQLALEIATKNTPEVIMINNKNQNEIQNHEQYGEYENHCSVISVENGYIHRVSQSNPRRECVNNTKNESI
jgi:hypothetical protein